MKGILGKKMGMTQVFTKNGKVTPVTVIEVEPNVITQVKNNEVDGYNAIQLGVEDKREKLSTKPEAGHFKKADTVGKRFVKEMRLDDEQVSKYEIGKKIDVSIFEAGEFVDVQGTSKGKGFQGVIKRHNQKIGPMTHGSRFHRRPGSMGAVAPQVFKGKALPGQMGDKTRTNQNLEVVAVDIAKNVLLVKGNVPGAKNSFVTIKESVKTNGKRNEAIDLVSYEKKETGNVE